LQALWPLLKPGGRLLYATCSVLPDENKLQIQEFLATVNDAVGITIGDIADSEQNGWQLLPNAAAHPDEEHCASGDGFFYFLLEKRSNI
jgi:16S rRNA (cytosine967-C5)-methyltransferase